MKAYKKALLAAAVTLGVVSVAQAGPVLIAGTDADDHGSFSGGANQTGWKFMEQAFTNIGGAVTNGNMQAVCIGCNSSTALNAYSSAFMLAGLAGWSSVSLTNVADITNFFNGSGAVSVASAGLIYMPADSGDTTGGITAAQLAPVNANGAAINNFVAAGGGLFTQTQPYVWLTSLLPGLNVIGSSGSNLQLTAAGQTQFPGLTNSDVNNATPWHNYFTGNFGALQSLIIDPNVANGASVVIGGGFQGGGVIVCGQPGQPACPGGGGNGNTVPEPGSALLLGAGAIALVATMRRRRKQL